jgi:hypothetical protein
VGLGRIGVVGLTHLGERPGDTLLHRHRVFLDDRGVLHHLVEVRIVAERIPVPVSPAPTEVRARRQDAAAGTGAEEGRAVAFLDLFHEPIPVALVPPLVVRLNLSHCSSPLSRLTAILTLTGRFRSSLGLHIEIKPVQVV